MGKGKKDKKTDQKSGKSKQPAKGKKTGIFMGGTIGWSVNPDRNNYYNVVTSRDGTPGLQSPCIHSSGFAQCTPVIICPPNNYTPQSCPQQPGRRCC